MSASSNSDKSRSDLPLAGRKIIVPQSASDKLVEALRATGAEVISVEMTVTRVLPSAALNIALTGHYDWVVLTSETTLTVLEQLQMSLVGVAKKAAAVGASTAEALQHHGIKADLVPTPESSGQALAKIFPVGRGRVLLPTSALASPTLKQAIEAKGWTVDNIAVYTTETCCPDSSEHNKINVDEADAIVLTAGSNARAAAELFATKLPAITLGEPSARVALEIGFEVVGIAQTQDGPGLAAAAITALS